MIQLTMPAKRQLRVFNNLVTIKNGFVIGGEIGHRKLISQFIPVNFSNRNLQNTYIAVYKEFGKALLGVFFYHTEPLYNQWFLEDMVIVVTSSTNIRAGGFQNNLLKLNKVDIQ